MQSLLNRSFLCIALGTIVMTGCRLGPFHVVRGNGNVVKEDRSVTSFQSVECDGFMNIYLTQGATNSVQLEGESNVLKYIETKVEDGKLIISTLHDINLTTSHDLNVYVTLPQLSSVEMSGSGNIVGKNQLSSSGLISVNLSGSGSISMDVDAPEVHSSIVGSGKVTLKGQTKDLKVESMGSADFNGESLQAETTKVSIMGSGDAKVFSSVKLDVTIGGSGDVVYSGDPAVSSNVYGSGSLKKK